MAAIRGQIRNSSFSLVTNSAHWQASPPRMRDSSAALRSAAAPPCGSTA